MAECLGIFCKWNEMEYLYKIKIYSFYIKNDSESALIIILNNYGSPFLQIFDHGFFYMEYIMEKKIILKYYNLFFWNRYIWIYYFNIP